MEDFEKERRMRRAEQDKKDKELEEIIKSIALESAKQNHNVKETKAVLMDNAQKSSERRLAAVREENMKSVQLDSKDAEDLARRMSDTYRTLELNSNAKELDLWCENCGCIHDSDVVAEKH